MSAAAAPPEVWRLTSGGYARDVTTALELPDDVAVRLEEHAAGLGLTVAEFIREIAQRPTPGQAPEAFIGSADIAVGEPFDIHQARARIADELLREHDALSSDRARGSSRS